MDTKCKCDINTKCKCNKSKNHPTFAVMIAQAIISENSNIGSTRYYIKKYLEVNYKISPSSHFINTTIKKLLNAVDGEPRLIRDENNSEHYHVSEELRKKVEVKKKTSSLSKIKKVWTDEEIERLNNIGKGYDREKFPKAGKKWTAEEDLYLYTQMPKIEYDEPTEKEEFNKKIQELANTCQRTPSAIKYRIILLACKHFLDIYDPLEEFEVQCLCEFSLLSPILGDIDINRFDYKRYIIDGVKNKKITSTMSTTTSVNTTVMGI